MDQHLLQIYVLSGSYGMSVVTGDMLLVMYTVVWSSHEPHSLDTVTASQLSVCMPALLCFFCYKAACVCYYVTGSK